LSKLIKSNQVKIGDEKLIIPSAITISTEDYLGMHPSGMPSRVSRGITPNDEEDEGQFSENGWYEPSEMGEPLNVDNQIQRMLDDAQVEADRMLRDARESAVAIEAEALDQMKSLYEKTYQEALDAGRAEGFANGHQEASEAIAEALEIKAQWRQKVDALLPSLEVEAVHLVLSCVEKVLGEMVVEPDYVAQLLRVGFERIAYTATIEVRVCERDYDYALTLREKALSMVDGVDEIQFKLDYALEPGQMLIETTRGSVDVSIQAQIEKIRHLFESILEIDGNA